MNTPLRFLRDWLPVGSGRTPATHSPALQHWLDELEGQPPEAIAASLAKAMPRLLRAENSPSMRRMLLDALQAEAATLVPALIRNMDRAVLPLTLAAKQQAVAADNLLKVLADGYQTLALTSVAPGRGNTTSTVLQTALLCAVKHLAARHVLAYRAHMPASENAWRTLHQLFRLAEEHGVANVGRDDENVRNHYVAALLLAGADPTRFARHDVDRLVALCRAAAPHAEIVDLPAGTPPEGLPGIVLRPDEGRPGRKPASLAPPAGQRRFLNCSVALQRLHVAIQQADTRTRLADENDPFAGAGPLLPALAEAWRGPSARQFSRQTFRPRVDLVSGVDAIHSVLTGHAFFRRRNDPAPEKEALATSEWSILDESPNGFGLRFIRGELHPVEVGEIVGLRSREQGGLQLGLVRRVVVEGATRLELGVQALTARARAVSSPYRAIILETLPAHPGQAGVVSAPGKVQKGMPFILATADGGSAMTHAVRLLESSRYCEIWLLEVECATPST